MGWRGLDALWGEVVLLGYHGIGQLSSSVSVSAAEIGADVSGAGIG